VNDMSRDPLQQPESGRRGKGGRGVERRFEGKTLAALAVGVLIIVLAVANSQKVEVDLLVTTAHISLVIVIVIAILFGFVLGNLVRRRSHRGGGRR
jgi:uncharacterized integral membrane protein